MLLIISQRSWLLILSLTISVAVTNRSSKHRRWILSKILHVCGCMRIKKNKKKICSPVMCTLQKWSTPSPKKNYQQTQPSFWWDKECDLLGICCPSRDSAMSSLLLWSVVGWRKFSPSYFDCPRGSWGKNCWPVVVLVYLSCWLFWEDDTKKSHVHQHSTYTPLEVGLFLSKVHFFLLDTCSPLIRCWLQLLTLITCHFIYILWHVMCVICYCS